MSAPAGTIVTLYMNGTSVGQQTATSAPLDFAVPGPLADGQYLFTATAGTVSGLVSPFSTPFTVTVDNTPPAISSFGLDARLRRAALRPQPDDDADGRPHRPDHARARRSSWWRPGAETTADASGNFSFYPVNLPNLGRHHVHGRR